MKLADDAASAPLSDAPRPRRHAPSFWTLIACITVFNLPLLVVPSGTVIDTPDFTKYFVPIHQFVRSSLAEGRWPLWNPYNYAGLPFAANPQTMVFYPPTWLCLVLSVIDTHRFLLFGHCLLAALGMRFQLRTMGVSPWASLAGAIPYALGGYYATNSSVGHLTMVCTMAWLPWVVGFFARWLRDGGARNILLCGWALTFQVLAGEPQSSYYTVLLLVAFGAAAAWRRRAEIRRGAAAVFAGVALVGVVGAFGAAIQLLPTAEMAGQSDRSRNSYEFSTTMSMPFESMAAGVILPWYSGARPLWFDASGQRPLNINREFALYSGLVPLLLAALAFGSRVWFVRFAWGIVVISILMMLGSHTPAYRVFWEALPGLSQFRIPARANILFLWAISLLSAFGLERLNDAQLSAKRVKWTGAIAFASAIVWLAVKAGAGLWTLTGGQVLARVPLDELFVTPLTSLIAALVLSLLLARLTSAARTAAILGLISLDLIAARPPIPFARNSPSSERSLQLLGQLRQAGSALDEPFRVDLAPAQSDALEAMVAGVENVNGYWPFSLARVFNYVHAMRGIAPPEDRRHQFFDQLYQTERPFPLRLLNVRYESVFDAQRNAFIVAEDPKPLPRAWMVHRTEVVMDDRRALARLSESAFDPREVVLVDRAEDSVSEMPDRDASIRSRFVTPEETRVTTTSARGGLLVLSLPFYPGWKATVDGRPVDIRRADYLISAVPLAPGSHEVVFRFDPTSVRLGGALTLLTALLSLALGFRVVRRQTPLSPH